MFTKLLAVFAALTVSMTAVPSYTTAINDIHRTYYVSATGNDGSGNGSINAPWKTINRAALVMKAGDTCIIREGTYRETVTPSNSGTVDNSIRFQAYPGEKVTISGTEPVDGWEPYSGRIYATSLKWDLKDENQFFVNGETLWEARWPNLSEYSMAGFRKSMATVEEGTDGTIADPALIQPNDYWVGATLWCRGGGTFDGWGPWLAQTSKITDSEEASHKISFTPFKESYFATNPTKNNEYYIFGKLALLDSPMEWYVDSKNRKAYVMAPRGQVPAGIEMKKRVTALDISGKSYIEINGINLFAANINMQGADHCKLVSMNMKWLNYSSKLSLGYESQVYNGISITGDNNEVRDCTVAYTTGAGLLLTGNNNRVVNNYFNNINYSSSNSAPVTLAGSRNLISHNTMIEVGRSCIQMGIRLRGAENIIQYNDLSRFMMLSADGGAIYTFGTDGENTRIHHNKIHDWPSHIAHGIYLDAFVENYIVDHNVFFNDNRYTFSATSPYNDVNYAFNMPSPQNYNQIYNNTTYNSGSSVSCPSQPITDWYFDDWYGNRVQNNIFTNTIVRPNAPEEYVYGNNTEPGEDPKYASPDSGKFTLRKGSPAIDRGVVIPGITDGYTGSAPDIGAYEYGQDEWAAGCDFESPPSPEYVPVDTPYMNRLRNSGVEFGYGYLSGENYISGITDWTTTGAKNASLMAVDESVPSWVKRGATSKLILGGGLDGVEQVISGLKPNTTYRLAGWTYVDPGESVTFGVRDFGGGEKRVTNTDKQYRQDTILFTTGPQSTSAVVYIQKDSPGPNHAYADDFGVVLAR